MIQSQKVLWFALGFTSAAAAVMAVVVFKDLVFDRQTLVQHLKVDNIDVKVSQIEPALLRPNIANLLTLNVTVGKPE